MQTLLIDNYDSYTYNLFHLLQKINGVAPLIIKNDELDFQGLTKLEFDNVVISSGPGHPGKISDFGVCTAVLEKLDKPILGISLGHQGLAEVYGGEVVRVNEPIHGRRSEIEHSGGGLFTGIPQGFKAVRYHSLAVEEASLPKSLQKTAWTADGTIMGLDHVDKPIWSVQFHPESVETEYGEQIIENFKQLTLSWQEEHGVERAKLLSSNQVVNMNDRSSEDYIVHIEKIDHLYDPEQVFVALYDEETHAFWLDSSRYEHGLSRFSFMGGNAGPLSETIYYDVGENRLTIENGSELNYIEQDIFTYLDEQTKARFVKTDAPFDFNTGYVGYFGYELKRLNGGDSAHKAETPDASFIFADRVIAFDHEEEATYILEFSHHGTDPSDWFLGMEQKLEELSTLKDVEPLKADEGDISFNLARNREEYIADIARIKEEILSGETYEITLTNELTTDLEVDALNLYRILRRVNPAPYAAYLRFGEVHTLSSSPEQFVKVDRDHQMNAKPIKGTIKRGENPTEDEAFLNELRTSEKNRAENLMIVDLLRNDLGKVSETDSIEVPKLMDVESYETVHQLVSTVTGTLRADLSVLDLIRRAYAGGSMTGAPKIRSMQLIDEIENRARGIYSGAIGFIGLNGTTDLSIVIRTFVKVGNELSIGVGGAITLLSDAEEEYKEMLLKAEALLDAVQQYHVGKEINIQ